MGIMSEQAGIDMLVVGDLVVVTQRSGATSDASVDRLVTQLSRCRTMLFFSEGSPSLSSAQRSRLTKALSDYDIQISAVLNSKLTVGIATAMKWVFPRFGVFHYDSLAKAFNHIGLTAGDHEAVISALQLLARRNDMNPPEL